MYTDVPATGKQNSLIGNLNPVRLSIYNNTGERNRLNLSPISYHLNNAGKTTPIKIAQSLIAHLPHRKEKTLHTVKWGGPVILFRCPRTQILNRNQNAEKTLSLYARNRRNSEHVYLCV